MLLVYSKGPRVLKINFEFSDTVEKGDFEIPFNFVLRHKVSEKDSSILFVSLSVIAGNDDMPFTFEMETETRFNMKDEAKEKDIAKAVYLEAGPAIYPAFNELFADLGRKARLPVIALPEVDFEEFYKIHKDSEKKKKEKKSK